MAKINLDGVEAWSGAAILPPGRHRVRIDGADEGEKNGHPVVELQMSAESGQLSGYGCRDWIHITPNTLGRVKQFLEAVKVEIPQGDFEMPTSKLPGRQVCVLLKEEPKQDGSGMRTVVAAYMPADQASADVPGETPAPASTGKRDDDIPF